MKRTLEQVREELVQLYVLISTQPVDKETIDYINEKADTLNIEIQTILKG